MEIRFSARVMRIFYRALHGDLAASTLFDMDGVLCPENPEEPWLREHEPLPQGDYFRHLTAAPAWFVPSRRILGIVTGRLSRYKQYTDEWLRRHNVLMIRGMWMNFHTEREAVIRSPEWQQPRACKAHVLSDHVCPEARMFVESKMKHAIYIARVAQKPVLCTETFELLEP